MGKQTETLTSEKIIPALEKAGIKHVLEAQGRVLSLPVRTGKTENTRQVKLVFRGDKVPLNTNKKTLPNGKVAEKVTANYTVRIAPSLEKTFLKSFPKAKALFNKGLTWNMHLAYSFESIGFPKVKTLGKLKKFIDKVNAS